jgi:transposase-like protein
MVAEADERPKRRRYTTAERMKILEAVDEAGVVEAARGHGVPQTTVSNWLHRDATKVAKEKAAQRQPCAQENTGRASAPALPEKQNAESALRPDSASSFE